MHSPSRRSFLAASAAIPFASSRRAGVAAANDRVTLGFIGVGRIGRGHLDAFLLRPGFEVVAVCDVVGERRDAGRAATEKRYADRVKSGVFKGVRAYSDFRDLLAHKGLDAVLIATPDHWHAIPCVLAARAGKHIYCEKPLTQNIADGRRVVDEVTKAKVVFQTGSQQRSEFNGYFRKAVEHVRGGRIGRLRTIRIGVGGPATPCDLPGQPVPPGTDWDAWLGPAPERPYNEVLCPRGVHTHFPAWRKYQEYAGGALADLGAHHFDIAQWAMGTDRSGPVEVIPPTDPTRDAGLQFVYASGVVMIHNEFTTGPGGKELKADCVFEGTAGTILVRRDGIWSVPKDVLEEEEEPGTKGNVPPPTSDHKTNWLDAIKANIDPICPAEIGHRTSSVCQLGNIGYRLKRKLTWDPVTELFVGDDAANKELVREPRGKWKI